MVVKIKIKDIVYSETKQKILAGAYSPEDRMVDVDIAEALNVSRMPVREALQQLETEGYLKSTSRGFVLRQFSLKEIKDIFDIRMLLEPYAAQLLVPEISSDLIDLLRQDLENSRLALDADDTIAMMQANRCFRSDWLDAVPNERLVSNIYRLQDHAETVRLITLKFRHAKEKSYERNLQLLGAFEKRDSYLAKKLVKQNLADSLAYYKKIVEQENKEQ